jgi:cell surface protein SprA
VVPNYESLSPSRNGAYRISMITIGTAFRNNTSVNSTVFQQFEENVGLIKSRFNSTGQIANYEDQSQDVLIPAFIAAYTDKSADLVALTPFPQIPLPNWRLDYNGLSKLGRLKDVFQAVTLSHAYSSNYSVTNFTNSLEYTNVGMDVPLNSYNTGNNFATSVTEDGQVVPIYVISQVMISETFAPLIGINVRTKNKLTARFEYKTKRDLSLNITNAQVTELNNRDWSFELGYTKNNMRLPFRDQGRVLTLKNDITFKVNVSVNNSLTIQRKIEDANTISYVINQKLNVQVYFDRNVNEPHVSNSFPRTTTRFGTKLMYNLAQ